MTPARIIEGLHGEGKISAEERDVLLAYVPSEPAPIRDKSMLVAFAREHGLRLDWHEPDEQDVSAVVQGNRLDNAMGPKYSDDGYPELDGEEMNVVLLVDSRPTAVVNLADLLAWASSYGGTQ